MNRKQMFWTAFSDVFSFGDKDGWDRYGESWSVADYILRVSVIMFVFNACLLLVSLPITVDIVNNYYVFLLLAQLNYILFSVGIIIKLANYVADLIPFKVKFVSWVTKFVSFNLFLFITFFINMFFIILFASVTTSVISLDTGDHDFLAMEESFVSSHSALWGFEVLMINIVYVLVIVSLFASIINYFEKKKKKQYED